MKSSRYDWTRAAAKLNLTKDEKEIDMSTINAEAIAKEAGVDPKAFRQALRDKQFPWHVPNDWTVEIGSDHYQSMLDVLREVAH